MHYLFQLKLFYFLECRWITLIYPWILMNTYAYRRMLLYFTKIPWIWLHSNDELNLIQLNPTQIFLNLFELTFSLFALIYASLLIPLNSIQSHRFPQNSYPIPLNSNEFLWILMNSVEYYWIPQNFILVSWISTNSIDFSWILKNAYVFRWILLNLIKFS